MIFCLFFSFAFFEEFDNYQKEQIDYMITNIKTKKNSIHFLTLSLFFLIACQNNTDKQREGAASAIQLTGNETIDKLTAEIAVNDTESELYFLRGKTYYEAESYDEAINDLKKAIALDSNNINYLHLLADAYLDYYKSMEALDIMYRAQKLYPDRIPTLLKLSEFQLILKRNRQSLKTLDKILQIDPRNPEAFFMLGMNLKETGDTVKAINAFQTAVENEPNLIDAWLMLGNLYDELGNPLAIRFFDNALLVDSSNMEARLGKATHYHKSGKLEQALDAYRAIIKKNPLFADAYYNMGLVFLEQEKLEESFSHFNMATETNPAFARALFYKGLIRESQGNMPEAKDYYQQALNINPSDQEASYALQRVNNK